jgi:hypothetical protein
MNHDIRIAKETAKFFGKKKISFIAIDEFRTNNLTC